MTEQTSENFASPEPSAQPTTSADPVVLRFSSPEGLLAAVPYLWGFHPSQSLVVLGLSGPEGRQRNCYGARLDLPGAAHADWPETGAPVGGAPVDGAPVDGAPVDGISGSDVPAIDAVDPDDAARRAAEFVTAGLVHCGAQSALLIAYSDDIVAADLAVDAVGEAVTAAGIPVAEALRVDGERWWSYLCDDPDCCPLAGNPYDLASNQVTATAVFAGRHAYADRDEVQELVRPLLGDTREAMLEATERAEDQLTAMWARKYGRACGGQLDVNAVPERCAVIVRDLVSRLVRQRAAPSDDETAKLSVFTASLQARDAAWFLMTEDDADRHVELWRWVTQRAVPPYELAPAALLAFAAWLAGDNLLARFALDRAFAADPGYVLAEIVEDALRRGVSPRIWRQVREAGDPTLESELYSR